MKGLLLAYGAATAALLALDALWLGVIARPLYQQGIGHLMAEQPRLGVAALFYLLYPVGLIVFAVAPPGLQAGIGRTLAMGALFGAFAYGTYDLTNLATLKGWPPLLTVIDIAWGSAVSTVAAAAGKAVLDRFGTG